jgi:myosin heavy subunit
MSASLPGVGTVERERTIGTSSSSAAKKAATLSALFKAQLGRLYTMIFDTAPHYCRCIKPNAQLKPAEFDREYVARQLRYVGLMETIRIRRAGCVIA